MPAHENDPTFQAESRSLLRRGVMRLRRLILPSSQGLQLGENFITVKDDGSGNQDPFFQRKDGTEDNMTGGGGTPTLIEDADQNTKVQTEESADENIIRMDVAGTERFLLQDSSPHLSLTGDMDVSGHMALGADSSVSATYVLKIDEDVSGAVSPSIFNITSDLSLDTGSIGAKGVEVRMDLVGGTSAGIIVFNGLDFKATVSDANSMHTAGSIFGFFGSAELTVTDTFANLVGGAASGAVSSGSGTLTTVAGFQSRLQPSAAGATITDVLFYDCLDLGSGATVTNLYGLRIPTLGYGTNRYGIYIPDITGGTVARMIDVSAMQIRGSGEYTDAANETPMWLNEGATPTLRQVKWKDGAAITTGDKVLVLV